MRSLFRNRIFLLLALAGTGLSATAQMPPAPPPQKNALLVFRSESYDVCAGYLADGRDALFADRCAKFKYDRSALLNFESDYTIRSVLTGQCLARTFPVSLYKELEFLPCRSDGLNQRFVSVSKVLADRTWWRKLVPLAGPHGTFEPILDQCVVTSWPHPAWNTVIGVFLWSCTDGEYSLNKHYDVLEVPPP